ncbi:alpha/beta hydrolase [Planctomicrobium piriforme]|uniref:Acetyl esterase/lipase n=1 Tax=Planctomicrobium piriforme TaxID=1576369 RepID=A0A1I3J900_9PLAN|nr:alpha/beta hydrolase [Planctomicrobium piriforme]SFI56794.1 Acetyl esterase/lipase [Planctomicrobium piriforme]
MIKSLRAMIAGGVLVFSFATAALSQNPAPTQANVPYGPHPLQVLDFYKAESAQPTPLLFFIHGGGWMNGDKANPDFLAQALKSGMSVVSINYRLIPDAISAGIKPAVKAPLEDAALALQFVRSKAKDWNIDKNRIAALGGSAGGFSSLWLAYHDDMAKSDDPDPVRRESTRVRCVMGFVPQTTLDPVLAREWIPNNMYGNHAFALPSYDEFIAQREKLQPWIAEYSPLSLVSPDDPPTYIYYDSVPAMGQPQKDPPHSANLGVRLSEALTKAGVECEFNYIGSTGIKHPDIFSFFVDQLQPKKK